ncbi:hypothetical protein BDY17DRAFT_246599 [Neohortaea acidophila]|uniref:Uncharacterized protein n=1 Tax=Neohortaea acidophila TaxID=245834 RepID=A0A6A6Q291_9PEZI|nr:uncharacterized protein BDY17DRAFT_246599 [Neohortaea acidophila]KAF2486372.1 hypothetical protein BDY17DRAFT_246599 [Neohortaea acidophila]
MLKQRLRQPLPLLCALFLTALLVVSLYTVHGGTDVRDLGFYKFGGDSTSAEADSTIDPSAAESGAPSSDDRTFASLESVFQDAKASDAQSQPGEAGYGGAVYDTTYDLGLGFDSEDTPEYREIFSYSTRDRRFIPLFAEGVGLLNPNLIPHPTKSDMWILIARREMSHRLHDTEEEVVCAAGFFEDVLVCEGKPQAMAINTTVLGQCDGQMARVNEHFGPRDMRVFHGPNAPYVVYGSQSQFTCFGVWLQDARMLLDAFHMDSALSKLFVQPTELRRPGRWKAIEKNFFIFWDKDDKMYVHNDLWPQRSFAKLEMDGSVGEDLAPAVAYEDQVCYAKYMPHVAAQQEWLQQATNALAITLCKREDPGCVPSDSNTFNMHIFHVKSNYAEHRIYEPYVMLFQRTAPFAIHAISQQPLWVSGREMLTVESGSVQYEGKTESDIPEGHTERFYMTSVSWRTHGQRYHGYIDDVLFLGFGIEDSRAGAIDVLAGDILQDLAYC